MDFNQNEVVLELDAMDVEELEQRLELAAAAPSGWEVCVNGNCQPL